jgi:hypothetical protein
LLKTGARPVERVRDHAIPNSSISPFRYTDVRIYWLALEGASSKNRQGPILCELRQSTDAPKPFSKSKEATLPTAPAAAASFLPSFCLVDLPKLTPPPPRPCQHGSFIGLPRPSPRMMRSRLLLGSFVPNRPSQPGIDNNTVIQHPAQMTCDC